MSKLAIVIPAYKGLYFDQTLQSIAEQKNKDFTVYIGDDSSPNNLYSIVKKYQKRIPIIYKRFHENLGWINLVAQWERCIDLVRDEEWIWLFSDDDLISKTCVSDFYETMINNPDYDLFHFNVVRMDQFNNKIDPFYSFPEVFTSEEFTLGMFQAGYFSTVVEYIFRKSYFINQGKFQYFDLGWCSDNATWIKLSNRHGIKNIGNSKVFWRESLHNISSIKLDKEISIRKLNAQIEFVKWLNHRIEQGDLMINASVLQKPIKQWFIKHIKSKIEKLPYLTIVTILNKNNLVFQSRMLIYKTIISLFLFKIYRLIKRVLKRDVHK